MKLPDSPNLSFTCSLVSLCLTSLRKHPDKIRVYFAWTENQEEDKKKEN